MNEAFFTAGGRGSDEPQDGHAKTECVNVKVKRYIMAKPMKTGPTFFAWARAVVLLPANALVFIPAAVVWNSGEPLAWAGGWRLCAGLLMFAPGFALAAWTMALFHRVGKGTAAPWNPPQNLVVAGPYRHVRNPMLSSVFIMLAAEVLLTGSRSIAVFGVVFVCANLLYFPLVEERELLKRFGAEYARYKAHVPRYIPRLRPWRGQE